MWPCPSEGKDPAPPTRAQAPVPPSQKPTEAHGSTYSPGGRQQKQEELRPFSLRKGGHKHSRLEKMRWQGNKLQMKDKDKIPQDQINEGEISNLPKKEFRVMIVKMIQDLRNRMEEWIEKIQEMFNKKIK